MTFFLYTTFCFSHLASSFAWLSIYAYLIQSQNSINNCLILPFSIVRGLVSLIFWGVFPRDFWCAPMWAGRLYVWWTSVILGLSVVTNLSFTLDLLGPISSLSLVYFLVLGACSSSSFLGRSGCEVSIVRCLEISLFLLPDWLATRMVMKF